MRRIMLDCPRTGEPVPVARVSDRASFEWDAFEGTRVRCPHCGGAHALEKEEARLEEETPEQR